MHNYARNCKRVVYVPGSEVLGWPPTEEYRHGHEGSEWNESHPHAIKMGVQPPKFCIRDKCEVQSQVRTEAAMRKIPDP